METAILDRSGSINATKYLLLRINGIRGHKKEERSR